MLNACSTTLLQALRNADFVVEAINEDEALKKGTFRLLDQVRLLIALRLSQPELAAS